MKVITASWEKREVSGATSELLSLSKFPTQPGVDMQTGYQSSETPAYFLVLRAHLPPLCHNCLAELLMCLIRLQTDRARAAAKS